MKKISAFLSVILCLNIMLSVYADDMMPANATATFEEETVVSAQNDAEINTEVLLSETETIRQDILDSIGIMDNTSYFDINLNSYGNYFVSTYRMNNSTVSDAQRAELTAFTNELFNMIDSLRVDEMIGNIENKAYLAESKFVLRHRDESGTWKLHSVWVYLKAGVVGIKTTQESAEEIHIAVSDSEKIAKFLANTSLTSFVAEKNDTNTPAVTAEIEKGEKSYKEFYYNYKEEKKYITYALTDTIEFTFIVPDEYENKVIDEVASPGKTVTGRFERYKQTDARNHLMYHLILSGNKGTVELRINENTSFDGSAELYSYNFPISFINSWRVENSAFVEYKKGKPGHSKLKLTFENREIKVVLFEDIVCENLVYKNYSGDETLADQYVEKTEEDKEALIKDREENSVDIPEQDPERYVVEFKGPRLNDGKVYDYTINFIAEIPVDFTSRATSAWYNDLGEDVKVTLLGLNHTLEGISYQNSTLVRFKGSEGERWFKIALSQWAKEEASASVKNTYQSLISFDGVKSIANTVEFDTMHLDAYFEGENYELETITIKVGGSSVNVNADHIKYIGGGKMIYENIF